MRNKNQQAASLPAVSSLMRRLAAYMAEARNHALPPLVVEKTKHHLLDTLSAMVSGSRLLPGEKAIAYARALGGPKEACVIGSRAVVAAVNAALANGMSAHADETDDSHAPSLTHPGCGVVPAGLAMAERERAGGQALLRAVALGYDICARMSVALGSYAFREAGHSTHSFGPMFGAAAAAGSIAGFNAGQVRHLLSYTAQQASGVSCWARDPQHIEKAFDFGGMPGRNGVAAATMVAAGFTGVDDVFSGDHNFFYAFGHNARPQEMLAGLGKAYEIANTNIKRWPVGSPIQAPLDSLEVLIKTHSLTADDVARLTVRVSQQGASTVNNRDTPDICMQHMLAIMLLDGTVTFASSHDVARMRDPAVLKVRKRIELTGDDELQAAMPSRQGIIEILTRDGRRLRHHTRNVRGTAQNPVTRGEVEHKCYHLLAPVLGDGRARKLIDTVWHFERVKDTRELRTLLRA